MFRYRFISALALAALVVGGAFAADSAYGPLSFNTSGGDFYFAQDGQFAPTQVAADGVIEVHLKSAPFTVGSNAQSMNLALAQIPFGEISTDPGGYKSSRLAGHMAGGREPDSDVLLVYDGSNWSDGNTDLSEATSRKAPPMKGYRHAFQVNALLFMTDETLKLGTFKGTLHGYLGVHRKKDLRPKDIMPIRLVFE